MGRNMLEKFRPVETTTHYSTHP